VGAHFWQARAVLSKIFIVGYSRCSLFVEGQRIKFCEGVAL
jgi:hypothetical protein